MAEAEFEGVKIASDFDMTKFKKLITLGFRKFLGIRDAKLSVKRKKVGSNYYDLTFTSNTEGANDSKVWAFAVDILSDCLDNTGYLDIDKTEDYLNKKFFKESRRKTKLKEENNSNVVEFAYEYADMVEPESYMKFIIATVGIDNLENALAHLGLDYEEDEYEYEDVVEFAYEYADMVEPESYMKFIIATVGTDNLENALAHLGLDYEEDEYEDDEYEDEFFESNHKRRKQKDWQPDDVNSNIKTYHTKKTNLLNFKKENLRESLTRRVKKLERRISSLKQTF